MLSRAVTIAAILALAACGGSAPSQPTVLPTVATSPAPATAQQPTGQPATGQPGTTTPTPPTDTQPSPSAGKSPAGSPSANGDWRYLADFPVATAIEVAGVTAHGEGFVAVGFEPYPGEGFGGRRNGVVWSSADGLSWSRATPQALGSTSLRAVISLNGLLFAFGEYSVCPELSEEEECTDAPDAGNALWRSPDGADWQRLQLPDSLRTGILDGALTDGQQLVVFGSTGDELVGAVWFSPNGEQWSEQRELAGVDPINAMEAGAGRLVAFGIRYLFEEDDVETLAAFSEGGAFSQAALPAGQRGVIQDVAWTQSGFAAVGVQQDPEGGSAAPVALFSADGVSWTAAGPEHLPADAVFGHVLALDTGYLALGAAPVAAGDREEPRSWFSVDGLEWREHARLSGGAFRQLSSSSVGTPGVIVFATDFEPSDELEPVEQELGTVHAWFAPTASLP